MNDYTQYAGKPKDTIDGYNTITDTVPPKALSLGFPEGNVPTKEQCEVTLSENRKLNGAVFARYEKLLEIYKESGV